MKMDKRLLQTGVRHCPARRMRAAHAAIAAVVLGLAAGAPSACAGRIALRVYPEPAIVSNAVRLAVTVENRGDEPARDVELLCRLANGEAHTHAADRLEPGTSAAVDLPLGVPAPQPGTGDLPLLLKLTYTDPRGYPASQWTTDGLIDDSIKAADPAFQLSVADCEATPTGRLRISVRAAHPDVPPTEVRLTVLLPDEFGPAPEGLRGLCGGTTPLELTTQVSNRTALAGSLYRACIVAEWNQAGANRFAASQAFIDVPAYENVLVAHRGACLKMAVALLLAFALAQVAGTLRPRPALRRDVPLALTAPSRRAPVLEAVLVLGTIAWFLGDHIPPGLLCRDTTVAGGDTVAHTVLAAHMRESLFGHGRAVSWAGEWWCGFPAFQYYFPLPYMLMAALSLLMPLNVALKGVSVLGVFLLPAAAWYSAARLRLPRPGPALVALATVPLLFDRTHTMWGVNIYSTLAGMIANSISFSVMLFAIGSAWRDADEGRFRLRTALLLAAVIGSHFFTSIMTAPALALMPLLRPRTGFARAARTLAAEGALALLLMAWWLVPLVAKRAYAVDFGVNWNVALLTSLPLYVLGLTPAALAGACCSMRLGGGRFVVLTLWMALVAAALFVFGYAVSPVFVNIRLWPFVAYAAGAAGAGGLGILLSKGRASGLATAAAALVALACGASQRNDVRAWAEWNYSGLQAKPRWAVLRDLALPLDGTAGRLANDLHDDNNTLGSSRVFEAVPALVRKPVLEGGLVNSALGSLLAYYIQGETSDAAAGFPTMLTPGAFNITNATRHLELANVKQFIAHSPRTRAALDGVPQWWQPRAVVEDWALYELTTHAGRTVTVVDEPLAAVHAESWTRAALAWLAQPNVLPQPLVLADADHPPPPQTECVLDEASFQSLLAHAPAWQAQQAPPWVTNSAPVDWEEVTDGRIRFHTRAVGKPHVVKCTWFPNWKVRGADGVYRVTPLFMLVVPTAADVELYYGFTPADRVGHLLTALGVVLGLAWAAARGRTRALPLVGSSGTCLADRLT